jgi:hypothetical protein
MIATIVTLAILWFACSMLGELFRQDRGKMLAALEGNSWTANPRSVERPVTIRFNPPGKVAEPARPRHLLRAAA